MVNPNYIPYLAKATLLRALYTTEDEHVKSAIRVELAKRQPIGTETDQERHDRTWTY